MKTIQRILNREKTALPIGSRLFSSSIRRRQMSTKFGYRRRVAHRCGHQQNHTLHARCRQEADSWAHNLRKGDCDACKEKSKRIAEDPKSANLPELIGSPNQISWANGIRQRIYTMLSRSDHHNEIRVCCQFETRATWWIENRNANVSVILAHLTDHKRRAA